VDLQPNELAEHEARQEKPARTENRIADIEVLRAFAVSFVIIHHADGSLITWHNRFLEKLNTHISLGSGVSIFFVVSGFVITRSLLPSLLATRSVSSFATVTVSFWIRRAWRLLPSAWLWLLLIQIASMTFNSTGAFMAPDVNFAALLAGVFDYANFRFANTQFVEPYGASFPYWSLSLEEQFYFIFPILIFIFRKYIVYFAIFAILYQWHIPSIYFSLLMNSIRTDKLLAGVLIAVWAAYASKQEWSWVESRRLHGFLRVVAWALLIVELPLSTTLGLVRYAPAPSTIICSLLVFLAAFDRDYFMPPRGFRAIVMWLGSRSYGLYLIHIPAFCLTQEIWHRIEPAGTKFDGTFTVRYVITALVLLASLSELNYRFLEMPLRLRGVRIAKAFNKRHGEEPVLLQTVAQA
jgi:peptidoglycan/LPS O-acetylase OafA/YrhL